MNNNERQAGTKAQQSTNDELLTSAPLAANPKLAVRCVCSHEDGLTKGKVYDAHKQG
jgi:hypothetical protein